RGWTTVAVIFAILFMVFMHELGHYITARTAGMKVTQFFIGVGPKIWSFRRGETEYGLKAIPVAAYVKTIGMYTVEPVDPSEESRTYRQKKTWQRVLMASAGSLMHFLMALIAILVLTLAVGRPSSTQSHINTVLTNSPAAQAGLRPGDKIVAVDGERLSDWSIITQRIRESGGRALNLTVLRNGSTFDAAVVPVLTDVDGFRALRIGLASAADTEKGTVGDALSDYGTQFKDNALGLARLFSPSGISKYANTVTGNSDNSSVAPSSGTGSSTASAPPQTQDRPSSVIGIVDIGSKLFDDGWMGVLAFFVAVNIAIGMINLFPMLPFDGGHIAVALYEGVRSRKGKRHFVDVNKLMPATYAVITVMGMLALSAMYLDITKGVP
ncbi:MAG: putative rane-associated Zn-dependent protease, partial [Acidimicrobiia bacterium]|nr:putative rane-associated Zn-dependent protease [Acidimicrobiia bacterium]